MLAAGMHVWAGQILALHAGCQHVGLGRPGRGQGGEGQCSAHTRRSPCAQFKKGRKGGANRRQHCRRTREGGWGGCVEGRVAHVWLCKSPGTDILDCCSGWALVLTMLLVEPGLFQGLLFLRSWLGHGLP